MAETGKKAKKGVRPSPVPTRTTAPFWEAAGEGKLLLQHDPDTGDWQFYPRAGSLRTGRRNLDWREASGRGRVYSFTETYVPMAGFEDRVPYLLAMIDLDEGVRLLANLVNVTADAVEIGMAVKVVFETLPDGAAYYAFEPA